MWRSPSGRWATPSVHGRLVRPERIGRATVSEPASSWLAERGVTARTARRSPPSIHYDSTITGGFRHAVRGPRPNPDLPGSPTRPRANAKRPGRSFRHLPGRDARGKRIHRLLLGIVLQRGD